MVTRQGGNRPGLTPGDERRSFYRIDDEVVLHYREVDEPVPPSTPQGLPDRLLNIFTLSAQFAAETRALRVQLKTIESQMPAVATYLKAIDRKLDMVAQLLLAEELEDPGHATQEVSLSAGGLAFHSDLPLMSGTLLELQLVLLPAFTGLLTYGRVVYCARDGEAPDPAFPYRVAVEFEELGEETRDLITRHVLAREAARLRARHDREADEVAG